MATVPSRRNRNFFPSGSVHRLGLGLVGGGVRGGVWGGGAAPSPVKRNILIYSVPAAGSRTAIIYSVRVIALFYNVTCLFGCCLMYCLMSVSTVAPSSGRSVDGTVTKKVAVPSGRNRSQCLS